MHICELELALSTVFEKVEPLLIALSSFDVVIFLNLELAWVVHLEACDAGIRDLGLLRGRCFG